MQAITIMYNIRIGSTIIESVPGHCSTILLFLDVKWSR